MTGERRRTANRLPARWSSGVGPTPYARAPRPGPDPSATERGTALGHDNREESVGGGQSSRFPIDWQNSPHSRRLPRVVWTGSGWCCLPQSRFGSRACPGLASARGADRASRSPGLWRDPRLRWDDWRSSRDDRRKVTVRTASLTILRRRTQGRGARRCTPRSAVEVRTDSRENPVSCIEVNGYGTRTATPERR